MVTGLVGYTCRLIKSFSSRSFNSLASTLGVMPSSWCCSSVNRLAPCTKLSISASFHLPLSTYSASSTFLSDPAQACLSTIISWSVSIMRAKLSPFLKDSAFLQERAILFIVASGSFAPVSERASKQGLRP